MDDLRLELQTLGLGRHEAAVYAALVEHAPVGAAWIAKSCGLSRSSVYTTLDALIAKGLAGTTYDGEVKRFVASGHDALMDLLHQQQQRAQQRLERGQRLRERFERARRADARVPRIVFFEGQRGLRRVYLEMLREAPPGSTMLIVRDEFIWDEAWAFVHEPPWRKEVGRLKAARSISTRLLVNRSALERSKQAYYGSRRATELRFLPRAFPVDRFALYATPSVVSVLSIEDNNLVGIRIANQHLASSFGALFEVLWKASSALRTPKT